MTMVVKFMSGEEAPDVDTRKGFHLMSDVSEVRFERTGDVAYAYVTMERPDGAETYPVRLQGNVYVMSELGDQLAAFGVAEIPRPAEDGNPPSAA